MNTLAEFRAFLDRELGPETPAAKDTAKPISPGNLVGYTTNPAAKWLKPASAMLAGAIAALKDGRYEEAPSPTPPNRHERRAEKHRSRRSKMTREERARVGRLLEAYNRRTREVGESGRRNQGALKASGVEIGRELLFGYYNQDTGQLDPSDKTIAEDTGWSLKTVARARERLRQSGLLSWFRRSKWTNKGWRPLSNRYFVGQLGQETTARNLKEWGRRDAASPSGLLLQLAEGLGLNLHVDAA